MSTLRIAGIVRQSIVDGEGLRMVLFTQGCPHSCPGCHNPETHAFDGGYDCESSVILAEFDKNPLLKGVTISGGEPFLQAEALVPLALAVKARGKDLWCYSGYTFEQLCAMAEKDSAVRELLSLLDVLVDGPYLHEQRDLTLRFRGSANQRIIYVPRVPVLGEAATAS